MLIKEKVIEQINSLPEEFTLQDVIEKLIFIEKLDSRINEMSRDDFITSEDLDLEIEKW